MSTLWTCLIINISIVSLSYARGSWSQVLRSSWSLMYPDLILSWWHGGFLKQVLIIYFLSITQELFYYRYQKIRDFFFSKNPQLFQKCFLFLKPFLDGSTCSKRSSIFFGPCWSYRAMPYINGKLLTRGIFYVVNDRGSY